jgi:small subunit ribosomal protein S6
MDEEEKRLAKIKAHRETHVKRSAIPVAQPARVVSMDAAAEAPAAEAPAAVVETAEPPAAETVSA